VSDYDEAVEAMIAGGMSATAPLEVFRKAYEDDDNVWWRTDSGHHMNLFDSALEEIDRLTAALVAAQEREQRLERLAYDAFIPESLIRAALNGGAV
jgi:hypothetical protein